MAGIMAFLVLLSVPENKSFLFLYTIIAFLLFGCVVDEAIQYFLPLRNFSLWDAMASCAGILVFSVLVLVFRKKKLPLKQQ